MDLLQHTPTLTAGAAIELAREHYRLDASATPLPAERDQNFLLQTTAGDRFVLKIANGADERSMLEAQNAALVHLASRTALCPRVVADTGGSTLVEVPARYGMRHFVRLLTWLHPPAPAFMRRWTALFTRWRRIEPHLTMDRS